MGSTLDINKEKTPPVGEKMSFSWKTFLRETGTDNLVKRVMDPVRESVYLREENRKER